MVSARELLGVIIAVALLLAVTREAAAAEPTSGQAPAGAMAPGSIEEVLALKIKIKFDAQSLEFCMLDLLHQAQDAAKGSPFARAGKQELALKIIGPDLQMDGITRNMTVRDFQQEGTIAELLTALVLKANPAPGKSANDPEQKLLWVIGPNPDTGKESILITTRAAATAKKYTLPNEFQLKGK